MMEDKSNNLCPGGRLDIKTEDSLSSVGSEAYTEAPFVRKYCDSLIENVLQFTENNSIIEASRHFNIPHSTIYTWQKKLGSVCGEEKKVADQQTSQSAVAGQDQPRRVSGECEPSTETKEEGMDFAKKHKSYVQAEKKFGFSAATIKLWTKERKTAGKKELERGDKDEDFKIEKTRTAERSKRVREYSDRVKEAAVKYGKKHGWTAAAIKFQTSSTSVSRWATYHDPRSPWKLKVIRAAQLSGTKEASKRFKVAQSTLEDWVRVSGKYVDQKKEEANTGEDCDGSLVTEDAEDNCQVCGEDLAVCESWLEHLVPRHLTESGLCGVCGADEEDLETHFSRHVGDSSGEQENDEDPDVQDLLKDLLVDN